MNICSYIIIIIVFNFFKHFIFILSRERKIVYYLGSNLQKGVYMNKQGFTLIEILVVVLIIGILSAIALPQYESAVEKSRMSEALINLKAITDASQRYFQANPNEGIIDHKNKIADVDLRGGTWDNSGKVYTTDLFRYELGTASLGRTVAYRSDNLANAKNSYIYYVWQLPDLGQGGTLKGCSVGREDPEIGEQMCKFFLGM
ncbi:hypothetical protein B5F75_03100 [Candidatus Avelusimicrobium gallicola]|uniref:Type II secretion system protein GspG C-terminal domain-containing protein n=2 Tax=Candidatus Avelusimicrobium gallicola TaxID=2562704 RepID=A0A1Y4DCL7_9BACT|nr:hypothetical protein B5F75_03100 [Elusimicrobium sp. An273]